VIETLIHIVPLLVGLGGLIIGTAALLQPVKASAGFGIVVDAKNADYVRAVGARDIFIGLIFIYFWQQKDFHTLAWICVFTSVVSTSDFFITRNANATRASLIHLGATIAVLVLSFLLSRI
jgi:hypothetical protein